MRTYVNRYVYGHISIYIANMYINRYTDYSISNQWKLKLAILHPCTITIYIYAYYLYLYIYNIDVILIMMTILIIRFWKIQLRHPRRFSRMYLAALAWKVCQWASSPCSTCNPSTPLHPLRRIRMACSMIRATGIKIVWKRSTSNQSCRITSQDRGHILHLRCKGEKRNSSVTLWGKKWWLNLHDETIHGFHADPTPESFPPHPTSEWKNWFVSPGPLVDLAQNPPQQSNLRRKEVLCFDRHLTVQCHTATRPQQVVILGRHWWHGVLGWKSRGPAAHPPPQCDLNFQEIAGLSGLFGGMLEN